jgi:ATP-dependent DNA helicase DinG
MPESVGSTCLMCTGKLRLDAQDYLGQPEIGVVKEKRDNQIKLANAVNRILTTENPKASLVAEAGTGIGKSFAYLIPSIIKGKRVLVTTAKKTLQSQLIDKDLPYLKKVLDKPGLKFEAAYGKSNYACELQISKLGDKSKKRKLKLFLEKSQDALWSEDPSVSPSLSLSADKCKGSQCKHFKTCKYIKAKQRVSEANIVVANHWLFGLHLRLMREDMHFLGEPFDAYIVDEAHKIEDGVRSAYTLELKESTIRNATTLFGQLFPQVDFPYEDELTVAWDNLFTKAQNSGSKLSAEKEILALSDVLSKVWQRFKDPKFLNQATGIKNNIAETSEQQSLLFAYQETMAAVGSGIEFIKHRNEPNRVIYVESDRYNGCTIQSSPIDVGSILRSDVTVPIIHLSATLKINNSLNTFINRVGVDKQHVTTCDLKSPFDYAKQAALYVSKSLPEPTRNEAYEGHYRQALAGEIQELVEANKGNAFVLFTARDDMTEVYMHLKQNCHLPLFVQGNNNKQLLDQYNRTPGAVLLGLKSFWEGVDIPGDKLSLVIITKLPFPSMADPIHKAKKDAAGAKAFMSVDLPEMIIDLRQGVGRLIRTQQDRGAVAILDSRILKKRYSQIVLRSLELPRVTSNKTAILKYLDKLNES